MSDQADGLRQLVRARSLPSAAAEPFSEDAALAARSLVFTSGKGGVGTSNLALNLAIALGEYGQRVVLVDADLGLANLDLLCGLAPGRDLGDVLSGDAGLGDTLTEGPGEIRILPGAHGSRTLPECLIDAPGRIAGELGDLERDADFLLIDAGSGLNPGIVSLAEAADSVVLVTTPEPTSMADAHAALRRLPRPSAGRSTIRAVVNQAASSAEGIESLDRLAATSRQFLGLVVTPLGYVRADPGVPQSVRARRPFLLSHPAGQASRCVRKLARTLLEERRPRVRRAGFFESLAARWSSSFPRRAAL